ncbi:MAG: 4Fe-4S binding protein, partial [Alphaproteobacteria bacterium]|nr:4Fe-4S binding protein [Alphaproteobacteria bacterium]
VVEALYPEADSLGPVAGTPPMATVFRGGEALGYLVSTHEMVNPAGYAGLSFDIIVALGADGILRDHLVLEEHEPLIDEGMVSIEELDGFLAGNHGIDIRTRHRLVPTPADGVSGATISAVAMSNAIMDSAILAGYRAAILDDSGTGLSLDRFAYEPHDWAELIEDGSITSLALSRGELRPILGDALPPGPDDETVLTLYTALATAPGIGRNLFGSRIFRSVLKTSQAGDHQLLVASVGPYKWIPRNPYMVAIFDRIRVRQGDNTVPLLPENYYRTRALKIDGHPSFTYAARFHLPAALGFDAIAPWSLELDVRAEGEEASSASYQLPYRIPLRHVVGERSALEDAGFLTPTYVALGLWRESTMLPWQHAWLDKADVVAGILALVLTVTGVMLFQRRLARARRLLSWLRLAVLGITLVWLGWMTGTQLTIITVLTWLRMAFSGLDLTPILLDPPMVLLSGFVVLSMVLWGRGVFCGWLCPFGALQELLNKAARAVGLRQFTVPERIQKRLWGIKYVLAVALLGAAAISLQAADTGAEVEPFKTAISLHFQRAWPFVAYAVVLLGIGLFVERAFCRYLCPLGALLALVGRVHLFNWLDRRPECGSPCQLCTKSCSIGAIESSGTIIMSECLQCLDCQAEYHDDRRCPPLAAQRKQREALAIAAE